MSSDKQQQISEALISCWRPSTIRPRAVMVIAEIPDSDNEQEDLPGEVVTANFDCPVCMVNMLASAIVHVNDSNHDDPPEHLH